MMYLRYLCRLKDDSLHENSKLSNNMKENGTQNALTLKALNKNNVWDVDENEILKMWEAAFKDPETKENMKHYADIIRTAFTIEEVAELTKTAKAQYEKLGYKVATVKMGDERKVIWAIRKRPIVRVTDLTYENIHHITAAKLLEVIERNFGGGWESLSQSIQDIIESGFDISTTTLPQNRLHKPGGLYEKKVADGFDVLEIAKGTWVEAIFAKVKPLAEKPRLTIQNSFNEDEIPDDDDYNKPDEDEEEEMEIPTDFSDDLNEDTYRTTFEIEADPDEEAENLSDDL